MKRSYSTDLSDAEWGCWRFMFRSQKARTTENSQHPRDPQRYLLCFEERLPVAAFASRLRTPWETVYWCFRRWRIDGTFTSSARASPLQDHNVSRTINLDYLRNRVLAMNIGPTIRPGIASNHELPGRFVPGIHMQPDESLGTKLGPGQRVDLLHAGRDG
jgi:hypothetical protein